MPKPLRTLLALTLGFLTAATINTLAFLTAKASWPAFAAAIPHKHYTFPMLLVRLTVGALAVAGAACATTAAAKDNGRTAWILGALFLAASIPDHLYPGYVWPDYPVWYHLVYLAYLVPVAGLSALFYRRLFPEKTS